MPEHFNPESQAPQPKSREEILVMQKEQAMDINGESIPRVEAEKNVVERQSMMFSETLLRLMDRTRDKENNTNIELVNTIKELLGALEHQSYYDDESEQLSGGRQKELIDFLKEATKALRWKVGGGELKAGLEIDFSKWDSSRERELKKKK